MRAARATGGAAMDARRRGLAGARAPEGVQPAQPAALERDHARPAQVGDAGDLGPRMGPGGADAGAQREHATLRSRHARQAALEAQDGTPQGMVATAGLGRGWAVGQAVGRPAARAAGAGAALARGRAMRTRRASCRSPPDAPTAPPGAALPEDPPESDGAEPEPAAGGGRCGRHAGASMTDGTVPAGVDDRGGRHGRGRHRGRAGAGTGTGHRRGLGHGHCRNRRRRR